MAWHIENSLRGAVATLALSTAATAWAQVPPDRLDPALITRSLPVTPETRAVPPATIQSPTIDPANVRIGGTVRATDIVGEGGEGIAPSEFARAVAAFRIGALSPDDLVQLARAVADVARARGLVFASASIQPQPLGNGPLVVTLDQGRVDAVRSLGSSNAAADRILSRLVTHQGVTRAELERTLLLVGDIPGVVVRNTRYVRENGFGVLLVTIAADRASLYVQADNRGTREIGPWRTTEIGSLRGVLGAGDELALVASQTPAAPREFAFGSARYAVGVGRSGGVASLTGFYGATHAGGDLGYLDLTGRSYGGAIGYSAVLERSRARSLWLDAEVRTIVNRQQLRGSLFRDDRLTVATGTLRTIALVAGGTLRQSASVAVGLPVPGATREGDPLASRDDGDARFVTGTFQADWTGRLTGPLALQLAGVAQLASRPLLASAEISLGGPAFARAYDYSERTGDEGVLGSAELQLDLHRSFAVLPPRMSLYGFADGGTVRNLRDGLGGGSLFSTGAGLRLGHGPLDAAVEVALPIDHVRLDTDDRSPRVSARFAVLF
jgi:hemolysin activation/secretion protein